MTQESDVASDQVSHHDEADPPYYVKCADCDWIKEVEDWILADGDARMHLAHVHYDDSYHPEKDPTVVITDDCGRELERYHGTFLPEHVAEDAANDPLIPWDTRCSECHTVYRSASCPNCGHISEEARL